MASRHDVISASRVLASNAFSGFRDFRSGEIFSEVPDAKLTDRCWKWKEPPSRFQRLGLQARCDGAVTGAPSILCPLVQYRIVSVLGVDVWTSLTVVAVTAATHVAIDG